MAYRCYNRGNFGYPQRESRVDGTRIDVLDTAELVLDSGYTPADTADQLALAVAAVYHALAYYHDHPKQMRDLCQERRETEAMFDHAALKPPTRHSDVFCTDEHVPTYSQRCSVQTSTMSCA